MVPPTVIQLDPATIGKLYQGSVYSSSLAQSIGQGASQGADINTSIRQGLLKAGVATGQIKPQSLSPDDSQLLQEGILSNAQIKPPSVGGGGIFDSIGNFLGGAASDVAQNVTGFANDLTHIPQGLLTLGESAVNAIPESTGAGPVIKNVPTIPQLAEGMAKGVVQDFTNVTPGTLYRPLLDLATIPSVAGGLATRGAEAISRAGEAGRLDETGTAVTKARSFLNLDRPAVSLHPDSVAQAATGEIAAPSVPNNYSMSPFRRFAIEKPLDKLLQSRVGQTELPFTDTSLSGMRAKYVGMTKPIDILKGRISSAASSYGFENTKPLMQALKELRSESIDEQDFQTRFQALIRNRMLVGKSDPAEQALKKLDAYQKNVLSGEAHTAEQLPTLGVKEDNEIRQFQNKTYSTPAFREYFSNPTPAMKNFSDKWDESVFRGLGLENIDPWTHIQRTLEPLVHQSGNSIEIVLGQMPKEYWQSGNLAKGIDELQTALAKSAGDDVPEEAMMPTVASFIPLGTPGQKLKIIQDAVASMKEDLLGHTTAEERLQNPDYLPGRNITAKVGQALVDRLHEDPHTAERFMAGVPVRQGEGLLPNYFPSVSTHGLKVVNARGPLRRVAASLAGKEPREALGEYGRTKQLRLINAERVGMTPPSGFLHESDTTLFKQGLDRLDPQTAIRHVLQVERHVVATDLAPATFEKMALKFKGQVFNPKDENELINALGSKEAAAKWTIVNNGLLTKFVQSEDALMTQVAVSIQKALTKGEQLDPDQMQWVDDRITYAANQFVRDALGEANTSNMAIPVESWNRLIQHAKIGAMNGKFDQFWGGFLNRWRGAVLGLMPSWFLRTTVGHGLLIWLQGVSPVGRAMRAAQNYFGDEGFHVGPFGTQEGLGHDVPYGVEQGAPGAYMGEKDFRRATSESAVRKTIGQGVHAVNNFQRRGAFLSRLEDVAKQRYASMGQSITEFNRLFKDPDNITKVIAEHPDWVHHALNELDRMSYTFGQMSPWERWVSRYVMPFWGWYKFVSKFAWSLPLTYPGRADALTKIGQIGQEAEGNLGPLPEWLQNSVLFDTHDLSHLGYLSMSGLNPLGDVMNPFQGFQGMVQLGQLNPVTQSILEGMGYNTLTGGLENIDPTSGIVPESGTFYNTNIQNPQEYDTLGGVDFVPRFVGSLMRSFPQIRDAELALTQGRNVYPESIPLFNEKTVPTANPKTETPLQLGLEFLGVAPKNYNLQNYQNYLLKGVTSAIGTKARDLAKQKALAPK